MELPASRMSAKPGMIARFSTVCSLLWTLRGVSRCDRVALFGEQFLDLLQVDLSLVEAQRHLLGGDVHLHLLNTRLLTQDLGNGALAVLAGDIRNRQLHGRHVRPLLRCSGARLPQYINTTIASRITTTSHSVASVMLHPAARPRPPWPPDTR